MILATKWKPPNYPLPKNSKKESKEQQAIKFHSMGSTY